MADSAAASLSKPSVLLGLKDLPIHNGSAFSWDTSKIGNLPDTFPSITLIYPSCGICNSSLVHIVQLYCPLEGSPFHRVINVFACGRKQCWGKSESWKVLRSQYLEVQGKEEPKSPSKQEAKLTIKDWCEDADDWGTHEEEVIGRTSTRVPNFNGSHSSKLCVDMECTAPLQGLALDEDIDVSVGALRSHTPVEGGLIMTSPVPQLQPYYIGVIEEQEYADCTDADHAQKLLKEYQQREGINLEEMMSESFADKAENETYEKSVGIRDHVFHKFMKRISTCPQQILRYSWNGQPIFITSSPLNNNKLVPACRSCKSVRIFEFQLMPALVSIIQGVDSDVSVEFGTVLVYSCQKSCWASDQQHPLEEFAFVQEDPDQRFFE